MVSESSQRRESCRISGHGSRSRGDGSGRRVYDYICRNLGRGAAVSRARTELPRRAGRAEPETTRRVEVEEVAGGTRMGGSY